MVRWCLDVSSLVTAFVVLVVRILMVMFIRLVLDVDSSRNILMAAVITVVNSLVVSSAEGCRLLWAWLNLWVLTLVVRVSDWLTVLVSMGTIMVCMVC